MHTGCSAKERFMTPEQVARINRELAGLTPAHIIHKVFEATRPEKPIIASSFGPNSAALLHHVLSRYPDTEVVLADYGAIPRENWEYASELSEVLGFVLRLFEPEKPLSKKERWILENGSAKERLAITGPRKLEAMLAALAECKASVVFYGVRWPQNRGWEAMEPLMMHPRGFVCAYPLWEKTHAEIASHLDANGLPKHPAGLPGDRPDTFPLHPMGAR